MRFASLLLAAVSLVACSTTNDTPEQRLKTSLVSFGPADSEFSSPNSDIGKFFHRIYLERIVASPITLTYIGRRQYYDRWDDVSDYAQSVEFLKSTQRMRDLKTFFDYETLSREDQISYRVMEFQYTLAENAYRFRNYPYHFNQITGQQKAIPTVLIERHAVETVKDLDAYISRLEAVETYLGQYITSAQKGSEIGVRAPAFAYDHTISDVQKLLTGFPYSNDPELGDSPLMADIRSKLDALLDEGTISKSTYDKKLELAIIALKGPVQRAFTALIEFSEQEKNLIATDDVGVWRFPEGDAYYASRLHTMTTTNLSAEELHQIGLAEINRIHGEIERLVERVGFDGDLHDFFEFTRTDPQFYKPNTLQGRQEYITEASAIIDEVETVLPQMFNTVPSKKLVVKAVSKLEEHSAGKAYYRHGSADGTRPGTFYANLRELKNLPTFQMEALTFHEGIPGHHLQMSSVLENTTLPNFRRLAGFAAYSEGWAVYAESIPLEFGFYDDPYSEYGRLTMQLWRAARLVADTGIHHKRWTQAEAVDFLLANTPHTQSDCESAVERYIVLPGQGASYYIGMLKMFELRARAEKAMGDDFDLREFHDVILQNGQMPLEILDAVVDDWIADGLTADRIYAKQGLPNSVSLD